MTEEYFEIKVSENGTVFFQRHMATDLKEELEEYVTDYGTAPEFITESDLGKDKLFDLLEDLPVEKSLIIKGKIIVPQAVKVATKFELE